MFLPPKKYNPTTSFLNKYLFVALLVVLIVFILVGSKNTNARFSIAHFVGKLEQQTNPLFTIQDNSLNSPKVDTLKLLFAGDIMGHGPQIRSAQVIENQQYDYYPCFEYIKPILRGADLAVANLELSLPGRPPYLGYPMFRSPDDLIPALRDAGFNLLLTANNHCNDARRPGLENAIYTLRENGFYQTGTFVNQEEHDLYYPLLVYKKGFKLAFLNYTFSTNKMRSVPPTIINEIDTSKIKKDLRIANEMHVDAIIVTMHWGKEYQLEESAEQRVLARQLFDWGADLIIGSHPHVIQPIKTLKQPTEDGAFKEVLVAYSLGNFISNQLRKNTDGGILLEINLLKEKSSKKVRLGDWSYLPIWRQRGTKTSPYRVLPVSVFESEGKLLDKRERHSLKRFASYTRKHLGRYRCLEKKLRSDQTQE